MQMKIGAKIAGGFANVESDIAVLTDIAGSHRHIEQILGGFIVAAGGGNDAFHGKALRRHMNFLVFAGEFKQGEIVLLKNLGILQRAGMGKIGKRHKGIRVKKRHFAICAATDKLRVFCEHCQGVPMHGFKDYFLVYLKGVAMGAADVVPGVSGGTIAFITGIYETWVEALSRINFTAFRLWREQGFKAAWDYIHGTFMLALVAGILTAILTLAHGMSWLLSHQPVLTWSFFFGLVLACIWFLRRDVEAWNRSALTAAAIGAALAIIISLLPALSASEHGLLYIFFAAALAICAMILPGISGAFVLVLLGAYSNVLDAIRHWHFPTLITFALGAIIGLLSFARVLQWLFAHHRSLTIAVLTGFIAGSLVKIWPWQLDHQHYWPWQMENAQTAWALLSMAGGFALVFALETAASLLHKPASARE